MRRVLITAVLALAIAMVSCQKPYETKIDLGVNNTEIVLPSFEEGHCFITVFSNGRWSVGLSSGSDWSRLDRSSGEGIQYVRFDYDENLGSEPREAIVVVEGSGKKCEITITQPKEI